MAYGLRHWLFADAARVTDAAIDDAWIPLTVPGTHRAALAAIRTHRSRFRGLEDRIRVRTLVVWGAEDRLLPVSDGSRLAERIPGSRLVVLPDAGHLAAARAARRVRARRRALPEARRLRPAIAATPRTARSPSR